MQNISVINLVSITPLLVFLLLLISQHFLPTRDLAKSGYKRRFHNLLLFALNTLILRLAIPLTVLSGAAWAQQHGFGVFNLLTINPLLSGLICVVILDFAIYWQHVLTHRWGLLWRLHKIHHADHEMDVTTAIRFHPIELILSLLYRAALVVLLGAPAAAVIVLELLLFIGPAFNHSNLALPQKLDYFLRWVIVTPNVHRAHHSILVQEQNSNYGFFLIWWDKIFSSYTQSPAKGHLNMQIGVRDLRLNRVDQMLLAPFK